MTVHTPRLFGAEGRPMMHHDATTPGAAFAPGVSLAISAWDLAPSDVLDIHMGSGATAHALIERFALSGMDLNIDGDAYRCRPWKTGDEPLEAATAATSNWTIEHIGHD
jgi:hypothetical protein